jgi:RNA 3'-terminal phosphate cyclase (ATP)
MITLDGAEGEGGGQILRTSLALSLITQQPFRIFNIRAGRQKPGLLRQHLTAVHSAATISHAEIHGAELGSRELLFIPGKVQPGNYEFDLGSAGSTTLVLQTILLPLLLSDAPSTLKLEGGTHNPFAPPFEFLERAFLPVLKKMGAPVELKLEKHGFYPGGGGQVSAALTPLKRLEPVDLLDRGPLLARKAIILSAALPPHVAEREAKVLQEYLTLQPENILFRKVSPDRGPGNAVLIEIESETITELFVGFGQRGVPAEQVARKVADEALEYLTANVPVGCHLADQLLLPMALAGSGSFKTVPLSGHSITNMKTIRQFLSIPMVSKELPGGSALVRIG